MQSQRSQFRFPIQRRGFIKQARKTTLCEVLDLSESGLQCKAELPLTANETVMIEVQLDGDCIIHCELLVTHVNPPHFGGRIVNLQPEHQQDLAQYIERLVRLSMTTP
jgi:hypothetical protein